LKRFHSRKIISGYEKTIHPWLVVVAIIVTSSFKMQPSADADIAYPEGYRNWMHIKSGIVAPDHQNILYRGFNQVYANEKAMQGYRTRNFPHGTVSVFDVVEALPNENYTAEGKRRQMDVISRDTIKFASTEWGGMPNSKMMTPRGC
jgi:hypothetical protein